MVEDLRRAAAWYLVTWEWVFLFAGWLAARVEVGDVADAKAIPVVIALGCAILSAIILAVAIRLGGRPVRLLALLGLGPIVWIVVDFAQRAPETFGG